MEAYPIEYTQHNLPLIFLSGLGEYGTPTDTQQPRKEGGTLINTKSPECRGERVQQLFQQFYRLDGTNQSWSSSALPGPSGTMRYRMKAIGRVGMGDGSVEKRRVMTNLVL